MHSGTFWNFLHAFWNILHHSGTFWNILHAHWNILELSACILKHSGTFCMHSGTFWNILDVVDGCRKVDFQVDDTRTDRRTDIHQDLLSCVFAAKNLDSFRYGEDNGKLRLNIDSTNCLKSKEHIGFERVSKVSYENNKYRVNNKELCRWMSHLYSY